MSHFDDLVDVTNVALDAALSAFQNAKQSADAIQSSIDALAAPARLAEPSANDGLSDIAFSLTHEKWKRWSLTKRRELLRELAAARAVEEKHRRAAQIALGRSEAAKELLKSDKPTGRKRQQ